MPRAQRTPPVAARPFSNWVLIPPFPGAAPQVFGEPADPELLWTILLARSEVADKGRALFTGSLAQRNALWKQLGRLLFKQAHTYFTSARAVR